MPAAKGKAKPSSTRKSASKSRPKSAGSANYPRHTVRKSLRIPQAILDQNAGNACSVQRAAEFLGGTASGPFRSEVSSSIKYGLLERPAGGQLRPTERARRILRPQSESDELRGIRDAVLEAPQISDVYKHYRGENLPDSKFLRNTVVETYSVPDDKFDEFHSIFTAVLAEAGLIQKHGDNLRILDVTEEDASDEKTDTLKKLGKGVKVEAGDTCFVMQPFSAPIGGYYEKIYKPAIEKAGLTAVRADADIFGAGKIVDQIWRGINAAKVLVAELTGRNPNVYYELGLAHALQKPVVLVSSNEEDVPFDLQHIRVIYYDMTDPFWGTKLLDKVAENIISALRNPEEAIFRSEDTLR